MQENTKRFGLIGKTLGHTFSKPYFEAKFKTIGENATYENVELAEISEVQQILTQGYSGLNVTIPYKEAIIPYLDELTPVANEIGAVNTVLFKNGKSIGTNTDAFGFKQMIKPFFESHHERALIIGTGGASKAVAYVLEELGVRVSYLSRTPKANNEFSYEDVNENMILFHGIIVNTSPVGGFPKPEEAVQIPYQFLTPKHLVIDLIYNPSETLFLKNAKAQGATVLNGLTMLHQQAEKAWELWNNHGGDAL